MLWLKKKKKKGAKSHFECRPFKWYLGATAAALSFKQSRAPGCPRAMKYAASIKALTLWPRPQKLPCAFLFSHFVSLPDRRVGDACTHATVY